MWVVRWNPIAVSILRGLDFFISFRVFLFWEGCFNKKVCRVEASQSLMTSCRLGRESACGILHRATGPYLPANSHLNADRPRNRLPPTATHSPSTLRAPRIYITWLIFSFPFKGGGVNHTAMLHSLSPCTLCEIQSKQFYSFVVLLTVAAVVFVTVWTL